MLLNKLNIFESSNNINVSDAGGLNNILDSERSTVHGLHVVDYCLGPVREVALLTKITERGFRSAYNFLLFTQSVGKIDQELSVSFPLVEWEHQNTGKIVTDVEVFIFGEVAADMVAVLILLC